MTPIPDDTITPVVPDDTITPAIYDTVPDRKVTCYLRVGHYYDEDSVVQTYHTYPSLDTIRYYANHPGCDTISILWQLHQSYYWTWNSLTYVRDNLEVRFDISQKVWGSKRTSIWTQQILPDDISNVFVLGMKRCDSLWFADHGFVVEVRPN